MLKTCNTAKSSNKQQPLLSLRTAKLDMQTELVFYGFALAFENLFENLIVPEVKLLQQAQCV